MTFKIMAYVMALGGCVLGIRFIFAGTSLLKEWGIAVADGPLVICRRLGAIYLGLALMFFLRRADALRKTDRAIGELAFELGYESDSAFSLAFRREVGCSPRAYRQESVEGGFTSASRA